MFSIVVHDETLAEKFKSKTYLNSISVIIGLAGIPTRTEVPLNRAVRQ